MKVSIITWDASFRESCHTIHSFCAQQYPDFEFKWVDYYQVTKLAANTIQGINRPQFKELSLKHSRSSKWNLGACVNEGVKRSQGELLILTDGDILVPKDFIHRVVKDYQKLDKRTAMYIRRFDQNQSDAKTRELNYTSFEPVCRLTNSTNYAGCLIISKALFEEVGGYETHNAFSGTGIIAMDLFTRLRNTGASIIWHPELKVLHPAHKMSGSPRIPRAIKHLNRLRAKYPWLLSYAGVEQSWIIYQRGLRLSTKASEGEINEILQTAPEVSKCRRILQKLKLALR